jgi:transposase
MGLKLVGAAGSCGQLSGCNGNTPAMTLEHLFTQALGLASPWKVVSANFDPVGKSLELVIDFQTGSRFPDPDSDCPDLCPVHDTVERTWQHLHFFEHNTTLRARVPRIKTPGGAVKNAALPWARASSGFTLLMEAYLLTLAKVLPVTEVSKQSKVSQDRIWHLIRSRVKEVWEKTDWSSLKRLGVDETSTRKGHKYGTAFLEIDGQETQRGKGGSKVARLLFFTPGKDKATFGEFCVELEKRGIEKSQIEEVAMDMSRAFIAGAGEHFPEASISFDRFHVMKLCGKAIDEVRKEVVRLSGALPKGALWSLRGNEENLSEERRVLRQSICQEHAKLGRAMAIRDFLADTWNYADADDARKHLKAVMGWCSRSRMEPLVKLGRSLKAHLEGILGYFKNYTTSAAIEAINGLLQLARRRARGYRNFANFQAIAYWIAGGLVITVPANTTH